MEWRAVALALLLIITLLFLVIPFNNLRNDDDDEKDEKLFEDYVDRFNKSYRRNLTEYSKRYKHFRLSLRSIEKLNKLRTSEDSAYYGQTQYSDLSVEEFAEVSLRRDLSVRSQRHRNDNRHRRNRHGEFNRVKRASGAPRKFDWREKGVVTPVRSQGICGACWAFSTVEVAESMFAIKNGTLLSFSVQEMIDCARNSNFGCDGGDICSLLMWLTTSKTAILPDRNYPLTRTTDECRLSRISSNTPGVYVKDFTCDSFVGTEEELLETISRHGPVAAAVNALSWQNYLGGVIQYHCDGSFFSLNHAVQIVGYDYSAPIPHYIVRNSWGPLFGDRGYLYIGIGNNLCGIANQVSSLDVT